ncbi:MAG: hypothetical protein DRR00_02825, partial [Candidatus Parabeggiatoa sp. nov. 3]
QGATTRDCPYEPPVGAIPCGCPSSWLFLLIKIPENLWFSTYILLSGQNGRQLEANYVKD